MMLRVDANTRVVALYGDPVSHSLSPASQNAAFNELKLNVIYLSFNVTDGLLPAAIEAVRGLDFMGANVTHPHKGTVMKYLDRIDEGATQVGAVNTVVNRQGMLIGYNTDGSGFLRSLREDYAFSPRGKRIVLLGTGGAGRAISWILSQEEPERLIVVNRTLSRAREWAEKLSIQALGWKDPQVAREIGQAHLVVNAASVPLEVDVDLISEGSLIYDIVYAQDRHAVAQKIRHRRARWADGRSLLLYQGALAFELWTGLQAPVEVMRKALWGEGVHETGAKNTDQGDGRC
jgi:shikimate dehydrogenase